MDDRCLVCYGRHTGGVLLSIRVMLREADWCVHGVKAAPREACVAEEGDVAAASLQNSMCFIE